MSNILRKLEEAEDDANLVFLRSEITRLRLTETEREAVEWAAGLLEKIDVFRTTEMRELLARTKGGDGMTSEQEAELAQRRLQNAIAFDGGCVNAAKKVAFIDVLAENERLKEAIRRLADQDATLSVVGGNVIVEMDSTTADAEPAAWGIEENGKLLASYTCENKEAANETVARFAASGGPSVSAAPLYRAPTLTDAEREAVECGIQAIGLAPCDERTLAHADTLQGLLDRLGGENQ